MAAYAAAVTSVMKRAVKIDAVQGIYMYAGQCDVTNYNTTLAEITGITGQFKSIIAVVAEGVAENGWVPHWVTATGSFKCFEVGADGPMLEATNDDDVGTFEFVAYGLA